MKTESEKIEISKQAAEIVGRPAFRSIYKADHKIKFSVWLVDDHGACAEIAADRRISTLQDVDTYVDARWYLKDGYGWRNVIAQLADFPSRIEATSWAICEAVIEQDKERGK